MGIGKKLSELIEQKGTNPNELADRIGITPSTIYSIIKRDNTKVDIEVLIRICEALDVNVEVFYQEYLKRKTSMKMPSLFVSKYYQLDDFGRDMVDTVLNKEYARCTSEQEEQENEKIEIRMSTLAVSAGSGEYLDGEDYRTITVRRTDAAERADFAVKINGDSMENTYFDDDILLVENTPHISVGEIGIFIIDGEGYVKEFGGDRLISHNPKYPDIPLAGHSMVICSGRVIGVASLIK